MYYRTLIPDGRTAVSAKTLLRDVNALYAKVGYHIRTTGKSAKVLGVTLAYQLGLSDDEIRILGRWRSVATAQHYRNVEAGKILKLSGAITLNIHTPLVIAPSSFAPQPTELEASASHTSPPGPGYATQTTYASCSSSMKSATPKVATSGPRSPLRRQQPPVKQSQQAHQLRTTGPARAIQPVAFYKHLGGDRSEVIMNPYR